MHPGQQHEITQTQPKKSTGIFHCERNECTMIIILKNWEKCSQNFKLDLRSLIFPFTSI